MKNIVKETKIIQLSVCYSPIGSTVRKVLIYILSIATILRCSSHLSQTTPIPVKQESNVFASENTYALLIGILDWKDPSLLKFPKKDRKDREFKEILLKKGVPESQILYLEDSQASLAQIRLSLREILKHAPKRSTFLFYFAGHGDRESEETFLMNYDVNPEKLLQTAFSVTELKNTIAKHFSGDRVLFFADCCYSGGLAQAVKSLADTGLKAAALTSAHELAGSTGNWTFTQALIDVFSGNTGIDRSGEGKIRYSQAAEFIHREMMYKENQLNGEEHSKNFDLGFLLTATDVCKTLQTEAFYVGDYVEVFVQAKWQVGKITDYTAPYFKLTLTEGGSVESLGSNLRSPVFREFSIGVKTSVLCTDPKELEGITPAIILGKIDKFYLVSSLQKVSWSPATWVPVECLK